MGIKDRIFFLILASTAVNFASPAFSQENSAISLSKSAETAGLEAYAAGDWSGASILLRKAVASGSSSDGMRYMLIMSLMNSENYDAAVSDCEIFSADYPESLLRPYVDYQKGRALYYTGRRDAAVMVLSDFCHQNPGNELYPSALFWMAESFYDDYSFETARGLYETVVSDFPASDKFSDSKIKLELIAQRERENKLLYLLKMTGEEYLSSKESYEKQLRDYRTEDMVVLRRQLNAANSRIAELEKSAEESLNLAKKREAEAVSDKKSSDIELLKQKAALLQKMVDAKYGGK